MNDYSYFKDRSAKPDTLTRGDHVYNPLSKRWEPVRDAYWSEDTQRYVVWCGPLGMCMHTYSAGQKVTARRYY